MSSIFPSDPPRQGSREHLMQQLRGQLTGCTADQWSQSAENADVFSCGSAAIDRLLPGGGLRHGMLVEWLGEGSRGVGEQWSRRAEWPDKNYSTIPLLHYSSAATLSLLAAREACREGGTLVVLDRSQTFYPPAAAAWGIDLDRLIVVRPRNAQDEQWAAVQSLRSPAVAAVWGIIDRLDSRAFRRFQLAAQTGRTLGLLLRPPSARGQPSWADVQLSVKMDGWERNIRKLQNAKCKMQNASWQTSAINNLQSTRRVLIRVLRTHGGRPGGFATLEIDDATYTVREVSMQHDAHPLPVVAELADPTDRSFSARA